MDKLHLKPAPGLQVRRENGTPLPVGGELVPNTSYYRRRLREGDLVAVSESATATKPKKGAE